MYTSERVADGLVKWSEARQVIRKLEPIDYLLSQTRWNSSRAAIQEARDLCALLRELADDIEPELDQKAAYLDALEEQAHRMTDDLQPDRLAIDDQAESLIPCPYCHAERYETESGDLAPAVLVSQSTANGPHDSAECRACGQAWGLYPDDPGWSE